MKTFIINLIAVLWMLPTLFVVYVDIVFWKTMKQLVGKDKIKPWYITDKLDTLIYNINQLKKKL